MAIHPETLVSTFDRTEKIRVSMARPETYPTLKQLLRSREPIIARGAGLSYSAASFSAGSLSIDMTRFDRVLSFDAMSGSITLEPGVRVADLLAILFARQRHLPALPGYPDITVGGCIAFDVHGKSQFHTGNFGDWIDSLTLLHPDHGEIVCGPSSNRDVFDLTVGGMGLTGIITQVTLRTAPCKSTGIVMTCEPASNLIDAVELMRKRAGEVDSLYSWNDLNLRGRAFGRGIVYLERAEGQMPLPRAKRARMSCRAELPIRIWNRALTGIAQRAYGFSQRLKKRRELDLHTASFPIEGKEIYYAAFGHRGLREYQLIVPFERWGGFAEQILRLFATSTVPVALGSLKLFRGARQGVRFRGEGVCLAVDVPAVPAARTLFAELDKLTLASEGLVNLSKDSRLERSVCESMFAGYADFRDRLRRFDPVGRHQSRLREVLGV
jgi:decaprenylphospho-beta-D-ribofuranose 2-oxidase